MKELFEFLFLNIEEKSIRVEVAGSNSELAVQIKQIKNRPGVAVHKLFFQMVLFARETHQGRVVVPLSKLVPSRFGYSSGPSH